MSGDSGYYPPPARRGPPWWAWMLGGCGGCLVLVVLAGLVLGSFGLKAWRDVAGDVGKLDAATIQRDLGDVPLYPGGKVELGTTRIVLQSYRLVERLGGKKPGDIFKVAVVSFTPDPPQKVWDYYEKTLAKAGWKRIAGHGSGFQGDQRHFRKGNDLVVIQTQVPDKSKGTMVFIFRGGPEMAEALAKQPPQAGQGSQPPPGGTTGGGQ